MLFTQFALGYRSTLKIRKYLGLLSVATILVSGGPLGQAQSPITIHGDHLFPESFSATPDGTLYIGSASRGMIFRAKPGASTAEPWIAPGTNGMQRVLGVLADSKSSILWVCSTKIQTEPTSLKTFDLKTGAPKGSYVFPGETGVCNDIAIGSNGYAYITDTSNGRILLLKPGAKALEVWAKDDRLVQADGIAFGDEKTVYINTFRTGHLFRIPVATGGTSGLIVEIKTSQPLALPDGLRPIGRNDFLMIEGAGRVDRVTIQGDTAKIEVLKDGFNGPTAVARIGNTAWVLEGKLKYMNDPAFKSQDPGPFQIFPVPFKH